MPYQIEWITTGVIIRVVFYGDLTMDEITQSFQELTELVENCERHLVHILMDTSQVQSHPIQLGALSNATRPLFAHPRMGWTLAYGMHKESMRYILQMLARIFQNRFRILENSQEAMEFLTRVDPLLE